MFKIKICGITNLKDAQIAVKYGANALGFVFYKKSPRYITSRKAKAIIQKLPSQVNKIGVFVNEKYDTVKKIADSCKLDALQFHGDESPAYCRQFKERKIIKAFRVKNKNVLRNISKYKVDAYLLDAYANNKFGGTGKIFNWDLVKLVKNFKKPVILSGGLNLENIIEAIRKTSPDAIDISSGLEKYPGKKNSYLVKLFFKKIKFLKKNAKFS